jgi:hypothetical protein
VLIVTSDKVSIQGLTRKLSKNIPVSINDLADRPNTATIYEINSTFDIKGAINIDTNKNASPIKGILYLNRRLKGSFLLFFIRKFLDLAPFIHTLNNSPNSERFLCSNFACGLY